MKKPDGAESGHFVTPQSGCVSEVGDFWPLSNIQNMETSEADFCQMWDV